MSETTTTPDSIDVPSMPTDKEVSKVYNIISLIIATVQKNWKTTAIVITVLGVLGTGLTKYVTTVSDTNTKVGQLQKQLDRDESLIISQGTRLETMEYLFSVEHKLPNK